MLRWDSSLFFVVLSLVASAVQEWVATLCGLRAKNLRAGIQKLLGLEYAEKLYESSDHKELSKGEKDPVLYRSRNNEHGVARGPSEGKPRQILCIM